VQHQGRGLSFELGGKRTSLLAHQTPLSRRGFSPKSVSGISRPLQTKHIPGNKTNKASMNATFSRMKSAGIVEEYKTKHRLTEAFLADWNAAQ
ncbi:hypothetical protein, partial [Pseudomonas aeruginosa]|uniref:hypothetical protein n=2 Tax=Pseudomonas aeruginosa TaxID=287 RepID=UPI0019695947